MFKRLIVVILSALAGTAPADAQQTFVGSATILKARLVRSFLPCVDPTSMHQDPWALPSCPAVPSSSFDFGPRGRGYVEIKVVKRAGAVTDERLEVVLDGVQTDAGTPVDDMLFHLTGTVRLTDLGCTGPCTVMDLPELPLLPVFCGRAAAPALPAGRCVGTGTLNGLFLGAVTPGRQGSLELRDLALVVQGQPAFAIGTVIP